MSWQPGLQPEVIAEVIAETYRGWLVRQAESPMATPVLYRGTWVRLGDEGNAYRITTPVGTTQ